MNYNYKYPLLFFKKNNNHLSAMKQKRFGLVSSGAGDFYKKLLVIDSDGQSILITKIIGKKTASFIYCIIYFQKMLEIEYEYEIGEKYSLEEVKIKVMEYVRKRPKYWLSLDTIDGINQRVNAATSFSDLFLIFR